MNKVGLVNFRARFQNLPDLLHRRMNQIPYDQIKESVDKLINENKHDFISALLDPNFQVGDEPPMIFADTKISNLTHSGPYKEAFISNILEALYSLDNSLDTPLPDSVFQILNGPNRYLASGMYKFMSKCMDALHSRLQQKNFDSETPDSINFTKLAARGILPKDFRKSQPNDVDSLITPKTMEEELTLNPIGRFNDSNNVTRLVFGAIQYLGKGDYTDEEIIKWLDSALETCNDSWFPVSPPGETQNSSYSMIRLMQPGRRYLQQIYQEYPTIATSVIFHELNHTSEPDSQAKVDFIFTEVVNSEGFAFKNLSKLPATIIIRLFELFPNLPIELRAEGPDSAKFIAVWNKINQYNRAQIRAGSTKGLLYFPEEALTQNFVDGFAKLASSSTLALDGDNRCITRGVLTQTADEQLANLAKAKLLGLSTETASLMHQVASSEFGDHIKKRRPSTDPKDSVFIYDNYNMWAADRFDSDRPLMELLSNFTFSFVRDILLGTGLIRYAKLNESDGESELEICFFEFVPIHTRQSMAKMLTPIPNIIERIGKRSFTKVKVLNRDEEVIELDELLEGLSVPAQEFRATYLDLLQELTRPLTELTANVNDIDSKLMSSTYLLNDSDDSGKTARNALGVLLKH